MREMIRLVRPKFFIPVHAGTLRRYYHAELGIEEGLPRNKVLLPDNGDSLFFTKESVESGGKVPHGSLLVDQTGSIVNGIVVKDRLMLSEEGILAVILSIDKKSGQLLTSPDIISRGFIAMRDNEKLMNTFRAELRRAASQRYKRVDLDRFKAEMRDYITHFLFEHTGRSPIVIPVINVIGGKVGAKTVHANRQLESAENTAAREQRRFAEMRSRLLGQDQRD
jgi:ribonuclease J